MFLIFIQIPALDLISLPIAVLSNAFGMETILAWQIINTAVIIDPTHKQEYVN